MICLSFYIRLFIDDLKSKSIIKENIFIQPVSAKDDSTFQKLEAGLGVYFSIFSL